MAFGLLPDTLFIALLTSTILAGVRRSSGLTFQTEQLVTNPTGVKVFSVYLSVGEWVRLYPSSHSLTHLHTFCNVSIVLLKVNKTGI